MLGEKAKGVMHHRFAILDGKRVLMGSVDRSEALLTWNDESISTFHEGEAVATFQKEFDTLW